MNPKHHDIDRLCVDTIRTLSMDAVEAAGSGHPGTPMALAPVVYTLWQRFMRYDPADPLWPGRDRFVLSAGHASMLIYSVLHLAAVKDVASDGRVGERPAVSLDDIKQFRQLESRCAGHPEFGLTTGVETTTGPLGQGVATSVGMAIAGRWTAAQFDRPGFEMFGYDVIALAGDGDVMEGISYEAASLAGHLKLSNLCWIYDSNDITIEGNTDITFTEDVTARFEACGWRVGHVSDANDLDALEAALDEFRRTDDRPTLIIVKSHIAYGAPNKQDSSSAHGAALGEKEVRLTKRAYGWPEDSQFLIPDGVMEHFASGPGARGRELSEDWRSRFKSYRAEHSDLADAFVRMRGRKLPAGWDRDLKTYEPGSKGVATRTASSDVLNQLGERIPWILGGSADLAPSNKSLLTFEGAGELTAETPGGRNIRFGVREHSMFAIANGLTLSGLRGYGATYLVFSDYARPAIRLAALMGLPTIHIFTHDSISVGEDGPTHQPIEQLASLRAMPDLIVLRPADANETVDAWRVVMALRDEPVALVLSRQNLPVIDCDRCAAPQVGRGAYILADCVGTPDVILIGTGSEVALCVTAHDRLVDDGVASRVVSMPSWELFERQAPAYRDAVLPPEVRARVTVEAGAVFGWERYAGPTGEIIGMRGFGESAPADDLTQKFGFTVEGVLAAARRQIRL